MVGGLCYRGFQQLSTVVSASASHVNMSGSASIVLWTGAALVLMVAKSVHFLMVACSVLRLFHVHSLCFCAVLRFYVAPGLSMKT